MQLVVDAILEALQRAWPSDLRHVRAHPLVPVEDNYERLGYRPDAVTRDARYTRYASEMCLLRSHTSAMIPPALRRLAREQSSGDGVGGWQDVLLACSGVVYRRDVVDRIHTGTPHQMDLWRTVTGRRMAGADLDEMIDTVVQAVLPGASYRTTDATHPYTEHGLQVDVRAGDDWVEVAECGYAAPRVLARAGLDTATTTGLAMGVGLDRLLMLRKRVPDIRLGRCST
jgi:phenylalanyl-tRNA synthetase alpha chain